MKIQTPHLFFCLKKLYICRDPFEFAHHLKESMSPLQVHEVHWLSQAVS